MRRQYISSDVGNHGVRGKRCKLQDNRKERSAVSNARNMVDLKERCKLRGNIRKRSVH